MSRATTASNAPVRVRTVSLDHPWRWLSAAWMDMIAVPGISYTYGAMFALCGYLLLFGLERYDLGYLTLPMALGFALIGPAAAVGLYETSRRLSAGIPADLGGAFTAPWRNAGQIALIGLFLVVAFIAWMRLAMLEFMLFFGASPPGLDGIVDSVMLSDRGAGFLTVGMVTGAMLAALVFAMTAIAVPMLVDRKVDAVTAMLTSLDAVRRNPRPMALWAFLIALFTFVGLMLFFVGLVLTLPLVGHASWHAYRDLVESPG
jgi:uncharacterized membrane protein